jgi:hypothetical protein
MFLGEKALSRQWDRPSCATGEHPLIMIETGANWKKKGGNYGLLAAGVRQ